MKIVYKPPPEHYEEATSYEWELAALDEYFQPKAEFKVLFVFYRLFSCWLKKSKKQL